MLQNKKILISIGIIVVIVLIAGGFFIFKNKTSAPKPESTQQSGVVEKLSAIQIGLKIEASSDKKKIRFSIGKLTGIKAASYELTYEADPSAQEKADGEEERVQRGVVGDAKFRAGDSSYSSPWLDLGSCSKNICKYDVGVKSIKLVLKITKDHGKVYQAEGSLEL
jgi:hypothetical protein